MGTPTQQEVIMQSPAPRHPQPLAGLGRTRRVLLGDTLLQEFAPEEIEVVFAHEVGHHVYRHLPKMIAWSVATSAAGFWLVGVTLHAAATGLGYARFDDP